MTPEKILDFIRETNPRAAGLISIDLTGVSAIDAATPSHIVFADDEAALEQAVASCAGMILGSAKLGIDAAPDKRVVFVTDPRLAFSLAAKAFAPALEDQHHSSAIIASTATISPSVQIGPCAIVGEGASIGTGCTIGARVVIEPGVTIGARVRVQAGAILGSLGFGYARRTDGSYVLFPQQGTLVIEDDVEIGANTTIDRGALGETLIGQGTKIDNLVHIGHNCRIGRNVVIAAQTGISGSTVVGDGAILGGQVGIGEHASVGPGVILGGGAGVLTGKKLNGAGQVFWGRPAQPLKQYLRDLARLRKGT